MAFAFKQTPYRRVDIHVHRANPNLPGNRFEKGALRNTQAGADTAAWWT